MRRILALLPLLLLVACDLAEEPFVPRLVVEAVLVAGEPPPAIRLSRTVPITQPIPPDGGAVRRARVRIERLDDLGEVDHTVVYREDFFVAGAYIPTGAAVPVLPLRRYRISVELEDEDAFLLPRGEVATGETLVPDTFRVVQPPPDTVLYDIRAPAMELRVTPSMYPGRSSVYVFSIIALEPEHFGLTPTYDALVDPEDHDRLVENSSPLLSEESYALNPDGTRTLHIPWFTIAYFGPNRFIASAVDNALYDFIRSRDAQFGQSTLSPGEIPDVITNLQNAVGVFGSVAQASVVVFVDEGE